MARGVLQTYPTYRIRWERLKEFLEATFQDWEHDFEEKRVSPRRNQLLGGTYADVQHRRTTGSTFIAPENLHQYVFLA